MAISQEAAYSMLQGVFRLKKQITTPSFKNLVKYFQTIKKLIEIYMMFY